MIPINLNYLQDSVTGALTMKTIVLFTHQVEFLPIVDKILVESRHIIYLLWTQSENSLYKISWFLTS